MTIFKRNFLIATGIYLLFYLTPILANPFMALNLLEAAVVGVLIFGGFYLSYIFMYTSKSKLDERTKSTIITVLVLLIALLIFFNPTLFNIIINRYLAILILLLILIFIILISRKMNNSIIIILLFAPSIIQGLLMRLSYRAMLFYIANPNFNLYLIVSIFIGYYIYNNNKK